MERAQSDRETQRSELGEVPEHWNPEHWSPTDFAEWLTAGIVDWYDEKRCWQAFSPEPFSISRNLLPQLGRWYRNRPGGPLSGAAQRNFRQGLVDAVARWRPESPDAHTLLDTLILLSIDIGASGIVTALRPKLLNGVLSDPKTAKAENSMHLAVNAVAAFGTTRDAIVLVKDLLREPDLQPDLHPILFVTLFRSSAADPTVAADFSKHVDLLARKTDHGRRHIIPDLFVPNFVRAVGLGWLLDNIQRLSERTPANEWFIGEIFGNKNSPIRCGKTMTSDGELRWHAWYEGDGEKEKDCLLIDTAKVDDGRHEYSLLSMLSKASKRQQSVHPENVDHIVGRIIQEIEAQSGELEQNIAIEDEARATIRHVIQRAAAI